MPLTFIALYYAMMSMANTKDFYLRGTLTDVAQQHAKVYLLKLTQLSQFFGGSNMTVVDSAYIDAKGRFGFCNKQVIEDNVFYRINIVDTTTEGGGAITMVGTHENFAFFLLQQHSQIAFTTSINHVADKMTLIQADATNRLLMRIATLRRAENRLVDSLVDKRSQLDPKSAEYDARVKAINTIIGNAFETTSKHLQVFADTVSDPYASLLATQYLSVDDCRPFFVQMNNRYKAQIGTSAYAYQFDMEINGTTPQLMMGTKAPNITLPDGNGQVVSLADFKGQYVLIDFWASWCSPCRVESKKVLQPLYAQYHHKGLAIWSISLDMVRKNWQQAIQQDAVGSWTQVCDFRGGASKVVSDYYVPHLPYNYLIDPDGVVIARDLHGNELENFIAKTLAVPVLEK